MPNAIVERLRFSEGEDKDCIAVKVHVWKKTQGNNSELEGEKFLILLLQEKIFLYLSERCRASDSE